MAYSYTDYSGNGVLTQFTVTFPYLDKAHVSVLVGGVSVPFSWLSDTIVVPTVVPPTGALNVRIQRVTPVATPRVTFVDGSTLTADQINQETKQLLYNLQEETDVINRAVVMPATTAGDLISRTLPVAAPLNNLGWASDGLSIINLNPGSTPLNIPASSSVSTSTIQPLAVDQSKLALDVQYRVDTIAALKALTNKYAVVLVLGYTSAGDGGGGLFRWNSTDTTADNTGTIIIPNAGGTGRWNRAFEGDINVKWFGAKGDGSTDDSSAIVAASAAVVARGGEIVLFPPGNYNAASMSYLPVATVIFIGNAKLLNKPYRTITPPNAPSLVVEPVISLNDIDASVPVAVLVGDSISSYSANTFARNGMLSDAIEKMLNIKLAKNTLFYNRAIPGTTLSNILSIAPNTTADWYTNPTSTWISYIKALAPDILFVSFGMNDSSSMTMAHLDAFVADVNTWPKIPKLVFCTCLPSSLQQNSEANQLGRENAAGLVRSYAMYYGHGLLDFNRMHNIARDGVDNLQPTFSTWPATLVPTVGNWRFDFTSQMRDYWVSFTLNTLYTPGNTMLFQVGAGASDQVFVTNNGGFYRFDVYADGVLLYSTTTSVAVVSGTTLEFEKAGNLFTFWKYDVTTQGGMRDPIFKGKLIIKGGLFTPLLLLSGAVEYITGPSYSIGTPAVSMPTATDKRIWGDGTNTGSGGSANNHPAGEIGALVYDRVLTLVAAALRNKTVKLGLRNVVTSDVAAVGGFSTVETYIPLADAFIRGMNFEVDKPITVKNVTVNYTSTNAGSAANVRLQCKHRRRTSSGVTETLLFQANYSVDPTGVNQQRSIKITIIPTSIEMDVGDILAFSRDGVDAGDVQTQDFRLTSLILG